MMLKRMMAACVVAMGSVATLGATPVQAGCGPQTDACQIDGGRYHIVLPSQTAGEEAGGKTGEKTGEDATGSAPVVMFLHGYGGSGAGVLKRRAVIQGLTDRGYAVIAPTAQRRNGGNRSWVFYPEWEGRDEAAFLRDVMVDASARFPVSQERVLLSGFSAGAFMVNYLACATPDAYPAYAPVSGGFWRPMPTRCAGPVKMLHTHGWQDGVVPLEGRILAQGRFEQGDIFAGLELWRQANGCEGHKPDRMTQTGEFLRRSWGRRCTPESTLELALFPGGHQVPAGWVDLVTDWFEDQVRP